MLMEMSCVQREVNARPILLATCLASLSVTDSIAIPRNFYEFAVLFDANNH